MGYRLAQKAYGSEFRFKHPLRRQVWVIVPLPSGKVGQKGIWGCLAANLAQGSVRGSILQVKLESDRSTRNARLWPLCKYRHALLHTYVHLPHTNFNMYK